VKNFARTAPDLAAANDDAKLSAYYQAWLTYAHAQKERRGAE
jgi:hypothetical protein